MPQGRNTQSQTSSRKVAIRASKSQFPRNGEEVVRTKATRRVKEEAVAQVATTNFAQVQALYTLVMTILFQTAGTIESFRVLG